MNNRASNEFVNRLVKCINVMSGHGLLPFGAGHISIREPATGVIFILGHLHYSGRSLVTGVGAEDVIQIDLEGRKLKGVLDPPEEFPIHTEILRARDDVGAVVHYHPQAVIAANAAGLDIVPLDVRSTMFAPKVPVMPYPQSIHINTAERAKRLASDLGDNYAVVLQGHGAVTVGPTPETATAVAFLLERAASMHLQIGALSAHPSTFPTEELEDNFPRGMDSTELITTVWEYYEQMLHAGVVPSSESLV